MSKENKKVLEVKKKYDVSQLTGSCVDDKGELTTKGIFQENVYQRVKRSWQDMKTANEKWSAIKDALQKAAKCCSRLEKRRQPDWFRDSYNCLKPLIEDRNKLYARWVSTGNQGDKRKYCTQRRFTRKVIREAKNKWFQQKASEAQKGRHGSLV